MKKTKFLLPALTAIQLGLTAVSCGKDPIAFESTNSRVMQNEIKWGDWLPDYDHNYMYVTFDWDAITTDVLNYGTVSAYVYDEGRQCPLPYAYPMGTMVYDAGTPNEFTDFLVEQLRCDFEPGKLTFIMQDLDGNMPEIIPYSAPITFRAVATVPVQYVIN